MYFRRTLVPGQVVIPIPLSKHASQYKVQFPGRIEMKSFKVKVHSVEMAYAVTVHKIQGQTKEYLIIDLNERPAPKLQQIGFPSLYVLLSRVRKGCNLKIMPLHNPQSLDYLFSLKLPNYLLEWLAGFNTEGNWSAEESKRNIQKNNAKSR